MLTSLPTRLKEFCEFDERDTHNEALKMGYDSNHHNEHKAFEYGSMNQYARLKPVLNAFVECVEAYEECYLEYAPDHNWRSEVLAKLESMLNGMEGEK